MDGGGKNRRTSKLVTSVDERRRSSLLVFSRRMDRQGGEGRHGFFKGCPQETGVLGCFALLLVSLGRPWDIVQGPLFQRFESSTLTRSPPYSSPISMSPENRMSDEPTPSSSLFPPRPLSNK